MLVASGYALFLNPLALRYGFDGSTKRLHYMMKLNR
jgi:hypothetical protein